MKYNPAIVAAFCRECGLPAPVFEYAHIPGRRFRLDLAWPEHKVGIEVQGGVWIRGAHSGGKGQLRDMEKRNLSTLAGWRVLEVVPKKLCLTETMEMVRELIDAKEG